MTASEILRKAREKFDSAPTRDIGCTSNCTGKCSAQGLRSVLPSNDKTYHDGATINPDFAQYCAAYNSSSTYSCAGHRDSHANNNRYPNPSDTELNSGKIAYAMQLTQLYNNIKQEINARLNHIFYSNLTF